MTTTQREKRVLNHSLAGTGAGMVEALLMQPTDVLKTRFQASRTLQGASILHTAQHMLKTEGLSSFYKGMTPVLAIVVPRVSLQFTGLALFTPIFDSAAKRGYLPAGTSPALAGVATGISQAILLVTPLELIKVRQQTATGVHLGPIRTIQQVIRHEGLLAMYKGLLPTMVRQSWGLALKFSFYTRIRSLLGADVEGSDPWRSALAGGSANVLVGILNSPPDVLKTRMQDTGAAYPSTWACAKDVWRRAGLTGFFRGASLRVLRIAPGGAIQFMVYEHLSALLDAYTAS